MVRSGLNSHHHGPSSATSPAQGSWGPKELQLGYYWQDCRLTWSTGHSGDSGSGVIPNGSQSEEERGGRSTVTPLTHSL